LNRTDPSEIRSVLTSRDKALLCKNFLIALNHASGETHRAVALDEIYGKMHLGAYNLLLVMPVILDDYLLPYGLVERQDDRVKITIDGRKICEQISKPEISQDEIMNIIESKGKATGFGDVAKVIKELTLEIQDIYRPRIFFDIIPDKKINLLNIVLRNSGRTAGYDITCTFNPDLPYYDKVRLSSLSLFKNLPFLEPDKEITFFYKHLLSIVEDINFPKKTNVKISYSDSKKNQYLENYDVDLERYKGILLPDFADFSDIHKDLENIIRQLDDIQRRGLIAKGFEAVEKDKLKRKSKEE
jgi:hypothetical protein